MEKRNENNKTAKEKIGNMEAGEDITKYGEFVSSYFAWMTLEQQKEKAKKLEDMTDKQ